MIGGAIGVVVLAIVGFFGVKALAGGGSSSKATASQGPANGGPGQGRGGRGTVGTLQSIDGSTLTLATFQRGGSNDASGGGTTTVLTNSSTKFAKAVTGSFNDIKVGDRVTAMGTPDGTNTLTAQRITDTGTQGAGFGGPDGGGGRRVFNGNGNGNGGPPPSGNPNGGTRPDPNSFAGGTVKSISGTTLTVTAPDNTTKTVSTNGSTVVSVVKTVSINDLTTGQPVTVRGTKNSDGTVTATSVAEVGGGLFGRGFRGGQTPGGGTQPENGSATQ
jgi:hypothetical protein